MPVLKLLLFPLLAGIVCLIGYRTYRYFNEKIMGSRGLLELLLFTFLLIAINLSIIILGLLALVKVYEWLS
jgi:hypothetical protein